jgi:hypothetical protein
MHELLARREAANVFPYYYYYYFPGIIRERDLFDLINSPGKVTWLLFYLFIFLFDFYNLDLKLIIIAK